MKFKGKWLTASLGAIADCISIMQDELPSKGFDPELGRRVYLFQSGAVLFRVGKTAWEILGHDLLSIEGAKLELRSADHVRQAINLRRKHDEVMCTPNSLRPTYVGLHGLYPNGQRTLR